MENLQTISILGSVLSKELGWAWPVFLVGCLSRSNTVFGRTRWATPAVPTEEARYAQRFSLAAAMYLRLIERLGREQALAVMRKILLPIGDATSRRFLDSLDLVHVSGIERFMAFKTRMQDTVEDRFNVREYITVDATTCHYVIKRCLAYDFFSEAGTPELTRLICEADNVFFPQAFPDLTFSRGDSWENTIAYGQDHCEYVLKKKA